MTANANSPINAKFQDKTLDTVVAYQRTIRKGTEKIWVYVAVGGTMHGMTLRKSPRLYNYTDARGSFSASAKPGWYKIEISSLDETTTLTLVAHSPHPALDKNPTDVVDSVQKDGEANIGQTKETGTMGYAHSADSTPGNDTAEGLVINFVEGTARVAEVKDDKGEVTTPGVAATGGTCRCGCGAEVKPGSKFLPGHDAKLKGKLSRAALAGVTVTLNGVEQTPAEAAYTDEYDYRSTVERAVELATEKAKSSEVKEAEKAAKKAAREAEAEAKKAAKQAEKDAKAQAKIAEAEAEALAKASSGTVDPAKADEVDAPPAQTEAPRAARRGR